MAGNFLETGTVNHSFMGYSYESVSAELTADMEGVNKKITHLRQMSETATDEETKSRLEAEYRECLLTQQNINDGFALLKEYPNEFPVL